MTKGTVRTYEEEASFIEQLSPCHYRIKAGFVPGMRVPGIFYVNDRLKSLLFDELSAYCARGEHGGFLPAVKQIANASMAMPDVHSGYGFSIGNVAAFDMADPTAVVSPGGVGFDINCGVRLLRTNLTEADVAPLREQLAQALFDHIPVGVGSQGIIPTTARDLEEALEMGMDWSLREVGGLARGRGGRAGMGVLRSGTASAGYSWAEDKEHCEEYGRMLAADPAKVSARAKKRGLPQMGTLGAGNHYAEIQVVDEVFDKVAARKMGIDQPGQVVVMIHSGSRGLGHQVATDALVAMEKAMARDGIVTNDRQLACARINSPEGQDYLTAMACATNYAWVNRASMTFLARQARARGTAALPPAQRRACSPHAAPPPRPPFDYQLTGQPVLIGGTMGTCSYVLTGTDKGMAETFGSTCHGAGRSRSRNNSRHKLDYQQVLDTLKAKGIAIRVASPKLVMEEAPESYKARPAAALRPAALAPQHLAPITPFARHRAQDVSEVVDTCHEAGISRKTVKLRPIAVVKG
eukprot:scaffold8.g1451.t1